MEKKITITAYFEPRDQDEEKYGPNYLMEDGLMPKGLYDIEIETEDDDRD